MPDWNNVEVAVTGINYTFTIENDGFYVINSQGYLSRIVVYVNDVEVSLGGDCGYGSGGWQGDFNFLLLNKGDKIQAKAVDGNNSCSASIIYVPYKR